MKNVKVILCGMLGLFIFVQSAIATCIITFTAKEPQQMTSCSWMIDATKNKKDKRFSSECGDWVVNEGKTLNGTISVTKKEGKTDPGDPCWRGLEFELTYAPGAGDPSGAAVKWIQVVKSNCPTAHAKRDGWEESGFWLSLDDYYNGTETTPWYAGTNTSTSFWDLPGRSCKNDCISTCPDCRGNCIWEAQAFLATQTVVDGKNNLNIYEKGWWWGFSMVCVPEPMTLVILAMGVWSVFRRRV